MCHTILEMALRKTSLKNIVDKNMPQAFRSRSIPMCTSKKESDYLPDRHVHTEENSYSEDDCRVLNEVKLLGCLSCTQ